MKELSKTCKIKEGWECCTTTKLKTNIKFRNSRTIKRINKEKQEKIRKGECLFVVVNRS